MAVQQQLHAAEEADSPRHLNGNYAVNGIYSSLATSMMSDTYRCVIQFQSSSVPVTRCLDRQPRALELSDIRSFKK